MNILDLLKRESGTSGFSFVALALISGIANALLLVIVNAAAETATFAELNFRYFILFAISLSLFFVSKKLALGKSTAIAEEMVNKVRIRISDKIRRSDLMILERIGKSEIYTRITQDTNNISTPAGSIIDTFQSSILISCCALYIASLSLTAFLLTVVVVACGVSVYFHNLKICNEEVRQSTEKETEFFESMNHMLDGFKEIKINEEKNDDLFAHHRMISDSTAELRTRTGIRFMNNFVISQSFFYILIAVIVFVLPSVSATYNDVVIKVTMAILFIIGPLSNVVGTIPTIARANVSVDNLYRLETTLDETLQSKAALDKTRRLESFETIKCDNIAFSYTDNEGHSLFSVGPFDLSIKAGEVLFIVGGNGSGKSTVLKLLTGLYYPLSGGIKIDRLLVGETNYPDYRDLFSAVFTDFHLFNRLYGLREMDEGRLRELMELMQLEEKTGLTNGKFTTLDLSTGQRKRLALVVAFLENKPIYVFDEVAADQDPTFRRYFYEVMLKDLKEQGKTVIAVTHDDRYFHVADRVLKMEYGEFVEDIAPTT